MKYKVYGIIAIFVSIAIGFLSYYLWLPALNLRSPGFWVYVMICIILAGITVVLFFYDEVDDEKAVVVIKLFAIFLAIVFGLFILGSITSFEIFHVNNAKNVAKITVSDVPIEEAFPDLTIEENLEKYPLVDLDTAILLGDKKIAGLPHASWYDVDDEYNLITYQGKNYRLSVIDYGGFWKFNKAKYDGLPGYVLVDVTPKDGQVTQEATVVVLDQPIRYSPGAFWGQNLRRHLRSQYTSYMFDTSYLEIDENGTPYWVTGILRPTGGLFGIKTVSSFILTNAQTGESQEFSISNAPEWIDHVFSLNYLMQIAEWHYSYVDGYFNNVFSKTNVWRTSYYFRSSKAPTEKEKSEADVFANFFGYNSILDQNGQVMFYTGLTAANNAESNLAWLEIDTSTGEMYQYNIVGAEESSAQAAVEALVQEKRYEATFPLPANIGGYPSYVMCLKGKAGLVQGYGICNIDNYSIAVTAETLDDAIAKYLAKVNPEEYGIVEEPTTTDFVEEGPKSPVEPKMPDDNPAALSPDEWERKDHITSIGVATEEFSGTIEAVYTAEIEGTTQFYYLINEELYRSTILINESQITYTVGDEIAGKYYVYDDIKVVTNIEKIVSSEEN